MDIAPPASPPAGGTYEGDYDNTAGTVAMMLYAKAFVDLEFECDTFLALWSSEEEGLRGSNAFANNDCDYCLPQDKELRFYINMDMMGVSWPALKDTGEPFPYHAWSGPDNDPSVDELPITEVMDHVHRNILKAPMDLRIDHGRQQHCTEQHGSEGMGAHVLERMFSFIKSAPPFFTHSSAGVLKGSNDRRASVV